jgi:NAD dependent epimerase/dehydratase family enzyme
VRNREFTRQLAGLLNRPAFIPAPEFALRLLMGEMAQVVLDSMRVVPRAANAAGYSFKYPDLQQALRNLLNK